MGIHFRLGPDEPGFIIGGRGSLQTATPVICRGQENTSDVANISTLRHLSFELMGFVCRGETASFCERNTTFSLSDLFSVVFCTTAQVFNCLSSQKLVVA